MVRRSLHSNRGAALPAAAVSAAILSIVVAGMLNYLGNEYSLNTRSHRWTQALHLAEAGVELGFVEYHYHYFLGGSGFTSARGWANLGGGSYTKTVTNLVDNLGGVIGTVSTTVTGVGTTSPKILGVGHCATTPRGPPIARAVRVTLSTSATFPTAMAAKDQIDMNGNKLDVDSFDSSDPAKSTSNRYDEAKRQANGHVATNSELVNSLNLGNADVYGLVATGPGGTVAMGNNGSVGPTLVVADRATTVAQGAANGWIRDDFQVDMPNVRLPTTSWNNYPAGQINNTSDATINSGNWRVSSIDLTGSKAITIVGNVRLHVTGNFSMDGNSSIVVAPNSSLEIYVAGASVSIGGNGMVNETGRAINSRLFGLPTNTSMSVSGNGQWIGTVYAPQAHLAMNGGGARGDMTGSIVANRITLNGQVQFHYDESLSQDNTNTGFLVASWQSLKLVGGSWVAE